MMYWNACRIDAEVGQLMQAERDHAAGGEHQRQSGLGPDDRRASLVVVPDAAVPCFRFLEASVVELQDGELRLQRRSVERVGLAADAQRERRALRRPHRPVARLRDR